MREIDLDAALGDAGGLRRPRAVRASGECPSAALSFGARRRTTSTWSSISSFVPVVSARLSTTSALLGVNARFLHHLLGDLVAADLRQLVERPQQWRGLVRESE